MEAETINAILLAMAVHIRRPEVCEQGFITFSNILLNGITIIKHINETLNYLFLFTFQLITRLEQEEQELLAL